MITKRIVLLYQGGIANLFEVDRFLLNPCPERNARRLYQGCFRDAAMFARGMKEAGCTVRTLHANVCGDAANAAWSAELDDAPFSNYDSFIKVQS